MSVHLFLKSLSGVLVQTLNISPISDDAVTRDFSLNIISFGSGGEF